MAPVKHPHASKFPPPGADGGPWRDGAVRVDPEEHVASAAADDMVQALAQMKCPSDYPQDITGKI